MKNLLHSILFIHFFSLTALGQISLEQKKTNINKVTFSNYGDKYYTHTFDPLSNQVLSDTITIYNSDWSVFKTIITPNNYLPIIPNGGYPFYGNTLLTDNLFNSDNLIEYVGCKKNTSNNRYSCKVFDENNNVVHSFTDTSLIPFGRVFKINNSFKFQLGYDNIYSVPGTIPCEPCNGINGLIEQNTGNIGEMKVYPNPFNNTLQVNYNLLGSFINSQLVLSDLMGREIKTIKLSAQSDTITIDTFGLPKGAFIISIYEGANVVSKKVIKVE